MKGTNRALTSINCIDFENADADEVVSDASIAPTGDWYVECFYYPDAHVSYAEVILANSNDQYIGTHTTSGRLRARIGGSAYITSASNTIPTGEWSRIVSQRSGSNVTFTVYEADGTQRWTETLSASSTAISTTTLKIGGIFSGRTINGKIAHVKIGNSSTDILAHYPLAEGSGTKVYDISGKGNHATSASLSYTTLNEIASNNHLYGFSVDSGVKIPALENKTIPVMTFDGNNDKLVATGIASSDTITHDGTATLSAGTGEITSNAGTAYNIKVNGVLTFTGKLGVGTTTITSENGSVGNATATNVTTSLFWGARKIDSNGIIVAADYAGGTNNETTSPTNPFGYVHNNSECSVTLAGGSKTFSQLDAVNNATATELFVRKSNGFIHEIIEPKSAVSGTEKEVIKRYANH
jgi:X-X-X-Leu-X-X-Gly heptad repeat protein